MQIHIKVWNVYTVTVSIVNYCVLRVWSFISHYVYLCSIHVLVAGPSVVQLRQQTARSRIATAADWDSHLQQHFWQLWAKKQSTYVNSILSLTLKLFMSPAVSLPLSFWPSKKLPALPSPSLSLLQPYKPYYKKLKWGEGGPLEEICQYSYYSFSGPFFTNSALWPELV